MNKKTASLFLIASVICWNLAVSAGYAKESDYRDTVDGEYVNADKKEQTSGALFDDITNKVSGHIGQVRVELGTGRHKHIDVDYQRVRFPHRDHQRRLLTRFFGNKEKACRWCHHKKRKGRDPRACRRCHAGRRVKSKGGAGFQKSQAFLRKRLRVGKPLRMKDCFHALCKGCHFHERELDEELDAQDRRAPIYCEGCHVRREEK